MDSHLTELYLQKSTFSRPQTLEYKNGHAVPRRPTMGIGQDPLLSELLSQQEMNEFLFDTSDVTYGPCAQSLIEDFLPAYVNLDKKVQYSLSKEDLMFVLAV